jgi:CDP-4-dehydro-6-deoxyglucose reductase, E1
MYNWPLNKPHFTFLDRLKLAAFFLNPSKRWTMDSEVQAFEKEMAEFIGVKYAIFVSSGSTANTLIAAYLKDKCESGKIIFPSTTWTTSISPFIREGFSPVFVDVNLKDLCLDLDKTEEAIKNDSDIKYIFITSLLGFVPDIARLKKLEEKYKVRVLMDNCENSFGKYDQKNISSYFTSTTSTYFGHQLQSVEGGFIFTNSIEEYEYFLMARNHGMVRAINDKDAKKKYTNPDVNDRFDFFLIGNNYRNTDIHAKIGRLDLKRVNEYIEKRINLYRQFSLIIDRDKFILPKCSSYKTDIPFSLPIIGKNPDFDVKNAIQICENSGIETRPIISGNLLRQTCYKKFGNFSDFEISEYLHNYGFYVGLHTGLTEKQIKNLTEILNKI